MNWLDMMQAIKECKKVRHKDWPEGKYLFLRSDGLLCVGYDHHVTGSFSNSVPFKYSEVINLLADDWLIYERPLLNNKEKKYLEDVLRPFRDRVISIIKVHHKEEEYECISIVLSKHPTHRDISMNELLFLPWFEEGTLYERMKINEPYRLKELGLFENKDFDF